MPKKGFRPKPNSTATLKFSDGDYEGAEVVCRAGGVPLGTYFQMRAGMDSEEQVRDVFQLFGDTILISWNVEDQDGNPRPPNGQSLLAEDSDFVMAIISAWLSSQVGVSAPLDGASNSGAEALPERPIPMAALSGSLLN